MAGLSMTFHGSVGSFANAAKSLTTGEVSLTNSKHDGSAPKSKETLLTIFAAGRPREFDIRIPEEAVRLLYLKAIEMQRVIHIDASDDNVERWNEIYVRHQHDSQLDEQAYLKEMLASLDWKGLIQEPDSKSGVERASRSQQMAAQIPGQTHFDAPGMKA